MDISFSKAQEILELTNVDGLTPSAIQSAAKKARKRWHPDNVAHLHNSAETERYTKNFQLIEDAAATFISYLAGTYAAGEKTRSAKTEGSVREPEDIIRENAPDMQAKLASLWENIKRAKYKWTFQKSAVSEGFKIRDLLQQDIDDDIATLSLFSYFYGGIFLYIPCMILMVMLAQVSPNLSVIAVIPAVVNALACIAGMLPLSRYWMPVKTQPLMLFCINWGLNVFLWVEKKTQQGAWWLRLVALMPAITVGLLKWVVIRPLFFIAKMAVGDRVIGKVSKDTNYYGNYADWYIDRLLRKDPKLMDRDELFDLSAVYSALGDFTGPFVPSDDSKPENKGPETASAATSRPTSHNYSAESVRSAPRPTTGPLSKRHAIMLGVLLLVCGLFYGGPTILQSVFNRHPLFEDAREFALWRLPSSLHVGDWQDIKSVSLKYSREYPSNWQADLLASGSWHVQAAITLSQKVDLFRQDDFAARARAVQDDSTEFSAATSETMQLQSKSGLPQIPAEPPLFTRNSAAGDLSSVNVEFDVQRRSYCWLGFSPTAVWQCWFSFFQPKRGWLLFGLPAVQIPSSVSDLQYLRTRLELPNGALIAGEPGTDIAIADYHVARRAYIAAVAKELARQKIMALNDAVRSEAQRQTVTIFYPSGGWNITSLGAIKVPTSPEGRKLELSVPISLSRTQAEYKEASADETARLMAPSDDFTATRKTAEEFFPALIPSWPQTPKLYVVAKPRGEVIQLFVHVKAHDDGTAWVLDDFAWESDFPKKSNATGLIASDITGNASFLDDDTPGLNTPKDWQRRQDEMIVAVHAEEKKFADRFGSDRDAWRLLVKLFTAAGGSDRLRQVIAISEQVHTKMPWPWLFGRCNAEGSGSVQSKVRPLREDEVLNVSFHFKPLLAGEETISFTSVDSTDEDSSRSETKDCFVTESSGERTPLQGNKSIDSPLAHKFNVNSAYAAHLLWHLAADDGPFAVRNGENPNSLIVTAPGYPDFNIDIDLGAGTIRTIDYTDPNVNSAQDGKPVHVSWKFNDYRSFSNFTSAARREIFVDGKSAWAYGITDVQYSNAEATNTTSDVRPPVNAPSAQLTSSSLTSEATAQSVEALNCPLGQNHSITLSNALTLDLVWIIPGTFTMGSPDSESGRREDEGPQSIVTISKGFWLGKTPVTQGQYQAVMGNNPSHFTNVGADAPVEQVSWADAVEFCRKLTEQERAAGHLPQDYVYTLPTEAQWEYACRSGTTTAYAVDLDATAWYDQNSDEITHPVSHKQPNAWGLYDMPGNVWELCLDWYGNYPGGSETDPSGPDSGYFRIVRGGSCAVDAALLRSADRGKALPNSRLDDLGFRVALAPTGYLNADTTNAASEAFAQKQTLPPIPKDYFNDYVNVVQSETAQELDQQLTQFDRDTKNQIIVAIYSRMPSGSSLADYARQVANSWGVGQKGLNNGVVLLVFVDDRKLQIEVGSGLEGVLPDALCERIIEDDIAPRFHKGDYDGGLRVGIAEILANVRTKSASIIQPRPEVGEDIWTTSSYPYTNCTGPGTGGGEYNTELRVGGWGDLYYSLLRFDLTRLPAHATSATLQLYCYSSNSGNPTAMYLDRIAQTWWNWQTTGTGCDYGRLWWADKPPTVQWSPDTIPAPVVGQWYSVDITDIYNAWQSGQFPNYGLQLRPVLNNNNFNFFYSSRYTGEPNLRPRISVTP